jgi:hypothetical protein
MQVGIYKNACKQEEGLGTPGKGPATPTEAMQAGIYKTGESMQTGGGRRNPLGKDPTPTLKSCRQASIRMKSAKKEQGRRNPWEGIYPDTPH